MSGSPHAPRPSRPSHEARERTREERFLRGAMVAVAEYGCEGATVSRIASASGVPRPRFYRHFTGREDCLLAAYNAAAARLGEEIATAIDPGLPFDRNVAAVVDRTLGLLGADPALAQYCTFHVLFAGPAAAVLHRRNVARLAALLSRGRTVHQGKQPIPPVEEHLVAAALWMIARQARLPGAGPLAEIAPALIYLLLVPYVGIAEARRAAAPGS